MSDVGTIPAESCYWVRLPPRARGWTHERVLAGIEPWIPSDTDSLDVCWAVGTDGQLLVLAVEPVVLSALLANQPALWMLLPDRIPDHVQVAGVAPSDLNLLHGRRAPVMQQRGERALLWASVAVSVVVAAVVLVGAIHRHGLISVHRTAAAETAAAALTAIIPPALGGNDPDPLLRLDQATRMAAGLRRSVDGVDNGGASVFAALLAAWPADLRTQVASLAIDGNRCTVSGTAASVADAQALATALSGAIAGCPGWRMLPLQASANTGSVSFTCTAVREGA